MIFCKIKLDHLPPSGMWSIVSIAKRCCILIIAYIDYVGIFNEFTKIDQNNQK